MALFVKNMPGLCRFFGILTCMTKNFEILLVDVDRTLYPFECNVWDAIGERIHDFIHLKLGLSKEEARQLRLSLRERYPTTWQGLNEEYDIDKDEYLRFVHEVDLTSLLPPNPALPGLFAALPQKKIVFTNSTRYHAGRVLDYFSIKPYFSDIIDVTMISPYTKFEREAFPLALEYLGNPAPEGCVMIDDEESIIDNAVASGMQGVLVNAAPQQNGHSHVQIPSINFLAEALARLSE